MAAGPAWTCHYSRAPDCATPAPNAADIPAAPAEARAGVTGLAAPAVPSSSALHASMQGSIAGPTDEVLPACVASQQLAGRMHTRKAAPELWNDLVKAGAIKVVLCPAPPAQGGRRSMQRGRWRQCAAALLTRTASAGSRYLPVGPLT